MVIHLRIKDKQHNGAHDAPRCNMNLGIYHQQYQMTDDINLVTCKKCLKGLTPKDIKKLGQFIKDYCHKTGKAIDDLYCPECETLSFKKNERMNLGRCSRYLCDRCSILLHNGSPGGQSDTFNFVTKEGLLEKQKNDENKRMTPLLIAMEFGFIECEKGHNLEEARKNLRKFEGGKQNE